MLANLPKAHQRLQISSQRNITIFKINQEYHKMQLHSMLEEDRHSLQEVELISWPLLQ